MHSLIRLRIDVPRLPVAYYQHTIIFLQATTLSKHFRHAKGTNIFKNVDRGQSAKETCWKGRARVEGWWVHDRCNIDASPSISRVTDKMG